MANKARRRPSWKKNPNRFVKEVYQDTLVIYGEDINDIIQQEIDREVLMNIKLTGNQ
jgi:DNA polymerase III alpha subunit (gram-positive type)